MSDSETFEIKWNNHAHESFGVLYRFQREDRFSDVTLHCEDRCIQAHRVVLAACSSYFERVLDRITGDSSQSNNHIAIVLKGVPGELAEYCIQFIYYGDAVVPCNKLAEFVALAQELEIRGLRAEEFGGVNGGSEGSNEEMVTTRTRKSVVGAKSGGVLAALQPSNVGSLKRKGGRVDGSVPKKPALDVVSRYHDDTH